MTEKKFTHAIGQNKSLIRASCVFIGDKAGDGGHGVRNKPPLPPQHKPKHDGEQARGGYCDMSDVP